MILTAQMASLYRLAIDRRPAADDDRPQPVLASTTLRSGLPELLPQREQAAAANSERVRDDTAAHDEAVYQRRQSDRQTSGGQLDDRRRQSLPTPIDTRLSRTRRRSDRTETIDFEI